MASKTLFRSTPGERLPFTDALNEEHAPAYAFTPKHALAQYAATGCLSATFYASEAEQLQQVLALCGRVEPEFIARTALFSRQRGYMKDMPALLCAVLSVRGPGLLAEVFDRVIDNGKMLRNFAQIMRSGAVGRKSLGRLPKRLVVQWLEGRSDEALFRASVGQAPSLADIIKMVHPKPGSAGREALFGYLLGRPHAADALPKLVKDYEAFKAGATSDVPDLSFQMLTALDLSPQQWAGIAEHAPWQTTRMNLNTFARHGVFDAPGMTERIAERLRNPEAIAKARVFPYQLMTAFAAAGRDVPQAVRNALQDAVEIAIANVPAIDGKVYVFPDVSGSMAGPVTGWRRGSTSVVRCVDVAALVAAALVRKNPDAEVIPFEDDAVLVDLNPRDSVFTNAEKLASLAGGGTNCSAPLRFLNRREAAGDLVVYVSDYESWLDAPDYGAFGGGLTETLHEWASFKRRNPSARMVCIDIQPYATSQAAERTDILNIGGFSDQVFDAIAHFAAGHLDDAHWVGVIESVQL